MELNIQDLIQNVQIEIGRITTENLIFKSRLKTLQEQLNKYELESEKQNLKEN